MNLTTPMMIALRGRRGLEEADKSQDDEILKMSPVEIVTECIAWELGYREWAGLFASWMVAAGAKPEDF